MDSAHRLKASRLTCAGVEEIMLQNKFRYLALLIIAGLLSVLYNVYFMGIIFLTITVLPFVVFGLLCYIYGRISADMVSNVHVANKGEDIPVLIRLNNPTIFPVSNITIYLTYKNNFSGKRFNKEFIVSVDRRTNTTVTCNILSEHAGNLEISLKKIKLYDYLKLFSLSRKQKSEIKVAILPYFHEMTEDYLSNRNKMLVESDYYSPVKSGDDPSEVFAIREYREGDRQQRIHWKLSMKQNQLMIKEFSEPLNCSILIFANLSASKYDNVLEFMDALMESALSLSYSFLQKGQIHYFSWYDETHGSCRRIRIVQEKDLYEAVDGLLQSGPCSEGIDVMTAYLAEHPNDQYTDLLYVTGEVSNPNLDSLAQVKANIRQIIFVSDANRFIESFNSNQRIKMPITEEIMKRISEMGIGLLSVDTGNVKANLERLKLG